MDKRHSYLLRGMIAEARHHPESGARLYFRADNATWECVNSEVSGVFPTYSAACQDIFQTACYAPSLFFYVPAAQDDCQSAVPSPVVVEGEPELRREEGTFFCKECLRFSTVPLCCDCGCLILDDI